jgi:hypothetical protein
MLKSIFPKDINTLIQEAGENLESAAAASSNLNTQNIKTKGKNLIKNIDDCLAAGATHINFVSAGSLSLHQLIEHLINKHSGKADLYLSTWAIKEAASRSLHRLCEQKKIDRLYGVFNYRIKTLDGKSFQLIEKKFTQYALTKNHAKVIVIDFIIAQYTIVCSANLSNNPRIEVGYISTDEVVAQFHKNWMQNVLSGKKVY